LVGAVRSYDFVGRYGGEEFLVVLNNCEAGAALIRAEEIREAIAGRPVKTTRGLLPVTMSLGALTSQFVADKTVEEILQLADLALYEAKAAGRNCVKVANPSVSAATPDCSVR
jgi:diguanylate cyclase (GGDEF)-like protein